VAFDYHADPDVTSPWRGEEEIFSPKVRYLGRVHSRCLRVERFGRNNSSPIWSFHNRWCRFIRQNKHPSRFIYQSWKFEIGSGSGSASSHFHRNSRDLSSPLFFGIFAKSMIFLSLESSLSRVLIETSRGRYCSPKHWSLKIDNSLLQGRGKLNVCMMWVKYMDGHQTDWADSAKSRTRGETWSGVSQ